MEGKVVKLVMRGEIISKTKFVSDKANVDNNLMDNTCCILC